MKGVAADDELCCEALSFSPGFSQVYWRVLPGNRLNGFLCLATLSTRLKPGENESPAEAERRVTKPGENESW